MNAGHYIYTINDGISLVTHTVYAGGQMSFDKYVLSLAQSVSPHISTRPSLLLQKFSLNVQEISDLSHCHS